MLRRAWKAVVDYIEDLNAYTSEIIERSQAEWEIVPHEETEWGTMFAIRSRRTGEIHGYDRHTLAEQRCAELNNVDRP